MENLIITNLKSKIEKKASSNAMDNEVLRNIVKEELQYYVLDFIYHHPTYVDWTMYGGSVLRICHELDRMSIDLDFEIKQECTNEFLNSLKTEITNHFKKTFNLSPDLLKISDNRRGLKLKFIIAKEIGIYNAPKHGKGTEAIHIKIDLNSFDIGDKAVTERIPINKDSFSFVIKTYNMSALMASKIAAVFLRGERGVGKEIYEEKGRDIYDLLWYMNKKIIPDLDYLQAKEIDIKNVSKLFDKLTIKMSNVSDKNLKDDLSPLFIDQAKIKNWLENWRDTYFGLLNNYDIRRIKNLHEIHLYQDFMTDSWYIRYLYTTNEDNKGVLVLYKLSDYWINFRDGDLDTPIDDEVVNLVQTGTEKIKINEKIKRYITLFSEKNKKYFEKTNNTVFGKEISTKLIRMTTKNLNQNEQIVLNKSALLSCELEDLLK